MNDPFYMEQWDDLCQRVQQSAEHHSRKHPDFAKTIAEEAGQFCQADPPQTYKQLLQRFSQAGRMAVAWMSDSPGSVCETRILGR